MLRLLLQDSRHISRGEWGKSVAPGWKPNADDFSGTTPFSEPLTGGPYVGTNGP